MVRNLEWLLDLVKGGATLIVEPHSEGFEASLIKADQKDIALSMHMSAIAPFPDKALDKLAVKHLDSLAKEPTFTLEQVRAEVEAAIKYTDKPDNLLIGIETSNDSTSVLVSIETNFFCRAELRIRLKPEPEEVFSFSKIVIDWTPYQAASLERLRDFGQLLTFAHQVGKKIQSFLKPGLVAP